MSKYNVVIDVRNYEFDKEGQWYYADASERNAKVVSFRSKTAAECYIRKHQTKVAAHGGFFNPKRVINAYHKDQVMVTPYKTGDDRYPYGQTQTSFFLEEVPSGPAVVIEIDSNGGTRVVAMFDEFPSGNEFAKFVSDHFEHQWHVQIIDSNVVRVDGFCTYKVQKAGGIFTSFERIGA